MSLPALLLPTRPQHGVTVTAREIAEAVRAQVPSVSVIEHTASMASPLPPRLHAHFTDRLWGDTPEFAADRFAELATRSAVTVTLHDLPQPSDGPANLARRTEAYARVVAAARGVVVNSRHEAALLTEAGIATRSLVVIPLAVDRRPHVATPGPAEPLDGRVAVLGFFYPGKGHDDVVDAVAELGGSVGGPVGARQSLSVVALGGASPGHDRELAELAANARSRRVGFAVTGFLSDQAMLEACRAASVPVVAHRHFSASGSLATWIAAGRRPLVVDSRYAREMAQLRPGTLTLVAPGELASAIRAARLDPASTALDPDLSTAPGLADTAAAHLTWWQDEVPW
jgi:glycosyltransferase involved in cell wall biosynthesis